MKRLLAMLVLLATAVSAFGRAVPLDPDRAAETADVIARIRVRRIMPAPRETGYGHMAYVAVGTALKGVKRGQMLYFLGDNGMICPNWGFNLGGDYIVYACKLPSGHLVPLGAMALIDVGPGGVDALQMVQEIRSRLAAIQDAKKQAMLLYPDLARPESKLNAEFVRRYKKHLADYSKLFHDTNWPISLAKESEEAIK